MQTICKDCIFAQYDGNTQTGCQLGRIEKFRKNGLVDKIRHLSMPWESAQSLALELPEKRVSEVIYEVELDTSKLPKIANYPVKVDDKEFYRINRFCTTCRSQDSDWAKDTPFYEWEAKVKEDISLKMSIVFYLDDSETVDDLEIGIRSSLEQTHKPCEIVVLIASKTHQTADILAVTTLLDKLEVEYSEQFQTVSWQKIIIKDPTTEYSNINHLIKRVRGDYFSIFSPNNRKIQPNFIHNIHVAINENLERFVLLTPNEFGNGATYQTYLFNIMEGNQPKLLEKDKPKISGFMEKIKYVANFNKEEWLIGSVDDYLTVPKSFNCKLGDFVIQ